jgi:hypothetical protein
MAFSSAEQAINVLFTITARLGALMGWVFIALAHLLVLQLLIIFLWASGTTPADLWSAFLELLRSNAVAVLGAVGLSVIGLCSGYWKLTKWVHRSAGSGLIFHYVTKTIPRE